MIYLGRFFASLVDSGLTRQSLVLDEVFRVCPIGPPGSGPGGGAVNGTKGSDGRAGSGSDIIKCHEGPARHEAGDGDTAGNRVDDGEDGEDGDRIQVRADDMVWRWEYSGHGGEQVVWRGMLSAAWDGVEAGAGPQGRMTRLEIVVCESECEGRAKGAGGGQGRGQWQWGLPEHVVGMLRVSTVCVPSAVDRSVDVRHALSAVRSPADACVYTGRRADGTSPTRDDLRGSGGRHRQSKR